MILDAETLRPGPRSRADAAGLEGVELPGGLKTELFASVFEIEHEPLPSAVEVDEALPALRRAAAGAAAAEGLASPQPARTRSRGRRPGGRRREAVRTFVGYGGISVRRQGVQGLHVHVGMPSRDACWRCLEAIVPWLPVVLALSANSPWLAAS